MADLDTNIPQISFGQADKETAVNELFDAASPSMLFGRNGVTSAGLGFGLLGGRLNGTAVANQVLTLADNSTLYLTADAVTGVVTADADWGEGIKTYKVTTAGGLVTAYEDHRTLGTGGGGGALVMADITDKKGKVLDDLIPIAAGDIDTTLTAGGYFVELDDGSSTFEGAVMHVVEAIHPTYGAAVFQSVIAPLSGIIATRYSLVSSGYWSDFIYSVTVNDVASWYNGTTTEAPNAVLFPDGSMKRSLSKDISTPIYEESGETHIASGSRAGYYHRFSFAGAKTMTFTSGAGIDAPMEFHITNRAASGNLTIVGSGVTLSPPKGGTLVLAPGDTVTVKFISSTTADVFGSTEAV